MVSQRSGEQDWGDLTYLSTGTARQRSAGAAIRRSRIMEYLAPHDPVLVGTIPLSVATAQSDLDILCAVSELDRFESVLVSRFGDCEAFTTWHRQIDGLDTRVASFRAHGWPFEVFGQSRPVREQTAYRHLVVEARLLQLGGESARRAVSAYKAQGWRTEPAFAKVFGIRGNAYARLLELDELDEISLTKAVQLTP